MTPELLDYAEKQADKLVAFSLTNMDELNKRAHTLVTLLFAAATGAGAFAVNLFEKGALTLGVLTLVAAVGWYYVAARAVRECLTTTEITPPGFEPSAILKSHGQATLDQVRHGALISLEERREEWRLRNVAVALGLDRAYQWGLSVIPCLAGVSALLCALVVASLG